MPKLEPEDVKESAGPATNIGGGLIDLVGKTLSGQATDRDPFGPPAKKEPAPGTEPEKKADASPPAEAPAGDPFASPDEKKPAPGTEPEKKADAPPPAEAPPAAPAGDAAPKQDASKKPPGKDTDPFK